MNDLRPHIDDLASAITERHWVTHPEAFGRDPVIGRQRCLEDSKFHLQFLASALDGHEAMFLDYVAWAKVMLAQRKVSAEHLADNLRILASVLEERFGGDASVPVAYVNAAIEQLPSMPDDVPSFLDPRAPLWTVADEYLNALLRGSRAEAMSIITAALDSGTPIRAIYREVFEPVQREIGRLWQLNQITVAQEHFCTAATQHVMTRLYAHLFGGAKREGRVVAMCVGGELHEVGLRIVTDLLELEGWQTYYLGASVPPAAAVQLCIDQKADVLLISATLSPHLAYVTEVVRVFRTRSELARAKVVVGGRAFLPAPELWRNLGADGYAANADDCIVLLDELTR